MVIERIDAFLDGGTIVIETPKNRYYIDNRIRSNEKGLIWVGYPGAEGSFLVEDQDRMLEVITESSERYSKRWYEMIKKIKEDIDN